MSVDAGVDMELHHTGVVVEDVEAAMSELSRTLGVTWTEVQMRGEGAETRRVAFSRERPRFELIEAVAGTLWEAAGGPHVHHTAYWTPDFDAHRNELNEGGMDVEVEGVAPFGGRWAYLRGPSSGLRIELCDTAGRDRFLECWGLSESEQ